MRRRVSGCHGPTWCKARRHLSPRVRPSLSLQDQTYSQDEVERLMQKRASPEADTTPTAVGDEAPASASPDSDPAEPLRRRPRRRRRTRRSSCRPGGSATLPPQGFPRSRLRSRWRFAATRTCVGRAQSVAIPPLATPERAHPGARESAADHRRGPRGTPRGTCHRRACARPYPAVACPGRAQPLGHRCRTGAAMVCVGPRPHLVFGSSIDGRTAVNSMGNRRCAVPDLYLILRFRVDLVI